MIDGLKRLENSRVIINTFYEIKNKYSLMYPHIRNMKLEFSNKLKNSFGYCAASCYKVEKIVISEHLINYGTIKENKETILHELAHALDCNQHGHDIIWKKYAKKIGLEDVNTKAKPSYNIPYKYVLKCAVCGKVLGKRHRKSKNLQARYRSNCCGGYILFEENKEV